MKTGEITITVHTRTKYAQACLRVAQWLLPVSITAADFAARRACVWVKLECGPKPYRWTRQNLGVRIYRREKVS